MANVFRYLALVFLLAPALAQAVPAADSAGEFSLFLWRPGFRVEREPVLEQKMSETDFRRLVKEKRLPKSEAIYNGCYLAHFQAPTVRAPAAVGKPKAETLRICTH